MKQVTVRRKCHKDTLFCDGEMIKTGGGTGNNWGSSWSHECNKCGFSASYFEELFPSTYIEFEENEKREEWSEYGKTSKR